MTIRWRDCVGRVDPVIAAEGRLFDLVVIAGTEAGSLARPTTAITDAYDTALLSTGRPVLVARPAGPMGLGRVMAIAWSGTLEASRAVAAATPWFAQAEQVHILTVGASDMARMGERLASSLAWRGVEAKMSLIEPGNDSIGAAILRRTAEVGGDLLVMGAYGRNRMREMIWGGVTRHVLTHPGPMVLMAH
jgi:nucleotide-binding universal stress UspA family protein